MAVAQRRWLIAALVLLVGLLPLAFFLLKSPSDWEIPRLNELPVREMAPPEQMAQAVAGLLIKPVYMLLSLVIIFALVGQQGRDLSALRWGQIAFLAGEIFCAINFYIYRHESALSEYLHSYGMAVAFGFTAFAVFEAFDIRLLRLSNSESACAALPLCGVCTRHRTEGCKAHALAMFGLPVLAALAFIPLASALQPDAYAVNIFGFPYSYTRFDLYEVYERRVLPLLALAAFAGAYVPLLGKAGAPMPALTKALGAAGLGALGFSFFRLGLNAIFATDLVWFEFWEETSELMFVGTTAFLLWQFRRSLIGGSTLLLMLGMGPHPHVAHVPEK